MIGAWDFDYFIGQAILEITTWVIKRLASKGTAPRFARLGDDTQQERLVIIGGFSGGKLFDIRHNCVDDFLGYSGVIDGKRLEETLLTVAVAVWIESFGKPVSIYEKTIARLEFDFPYRDIDFIGFDSQGIDT